MFLTKLDTSLTPGGVVWQGVYPPVFSQLYATQGFDMIQAEDGGYLVLGSTDDEDLPDPPDPRARRGLCAGWQK